MPKCVIENPFDRRNEPSERQDGPVFMLEKLREAYLGLNRTVMRLEDRVNDLLNRLQ